MVELSRMHELAPQCWHFDTLYLTKVTSGSLEDLEMICDEGPVPWRIGMHVTVL